MTEKQKTFSDVQQYLERNQLGIKHVDTSRPWGGFFVIEEEDATKFLDHFFSSLDKTSLLQGKLSPKMLLVEPGKKLSWQYHHRRAEIWKLVEGRAGVVRSDTDDEQELTVLHPGQIIELSQGERHRLVGLDEWGVIAEIWMHTQPENPSDEDDIVRVQDDFGR
jgi:mannose-6-phosphate isomerase-like protein (cupin superfamily)